MLTVQTILQQRYFSNRRHRTNVLWFIKDAVDNAAPTSS